MEKLPENVRESLKYAVKSNLSGAADNYARAKAAFSRMSPSQLEAPYGESGKTCAAILREYEADLEHWKTVVASVERI